MRIISIISVFLLFASCSQFGKKISKRVTKANRLPAEANNQNNSSPLAYLGSHIGSIQYSVLNKNDFMRVHGQGWVLADGRCVHPDCGAKNSDYALLTKQKRVPNLYSINLVKNTFSAKFRFKNGKLAKISESSPFVKELKQFNANKTTVKFIDGFFKHDPTAITMVVEPNAANRAVRITSVTKDQVTVGGNVVSNQVELYLPFDLIVQRQNKKEENKVNVFIKINDY